MGTFLFPTHRPGFVAHLCLCARGSPNELRRALGAWAAPGRTIVREDYIIIIVREDYVFIVREDYVIVREDYIIVRADYIVVREDYYYYYSSIPYY